MGQATYIKTFTNGILKENPSLRLVLGTCPTLAVTTAAFNGLGMGVAATFVLICSNMVISALRKLIPDKVRLPSYILIIAGFVTFVHMLVKAYMPALNEALGVYLPLITVNCIILGRAEMFASKNKVLVSAFDGLGMGVGFTITLLLMSITRELLGAGTIFGLQLFPEWLKPLRIIALPPGGFFVFGLFMGLAVLVETKLGHKVPRNVGCAACPSAENCPAKGGE
ncbi:MAG: electron transport complex subunit RsxE [Oscillospiraceae bacterium]